jgi:hypothetical protein
MAKSETPVSSADLFVGNQSALFYLGAQEIIVYPGLLVRRDNPVRLARPHMFDVLVLELAYEDPGLEPSQTTVVVCGASGTEHGSEMVRVKRFRTRPPSEVLSS